LPVKHQTTRESCEAMRMGGHVVSGV
jgi:hypothetical protein